MKSKDKKTIVDYFREHLDSGKVIFDVDTGKNATFAEVYHNAQAIKGQFYAHDQKIISVVIPNSIAYIEYLLAVLETNNIFNPIPYFTSLNELKKVLTYIEPAYLVTDRDDVLKEFSGTYDLIDPRKVSSDKKSYPLKDIDENKPAALYYSSGTTGDPKGVLYSHKNMVSLIASINRGFRFTAEDNQFAFLPFGHTASINYNILPALMAGSNLYISQGFDHLREKFFEVLAKYKITYTEIVPTVLFMLLKLKIDISQYDLKYLRFIGCGSSTLPVTSQKDFIKQYGIKAANLYGLSETGPSHIDYPLDEGWKPGAIGLPLDVNECKIAHDGEILLKGDNIFIGYYKNENLYHQVVKDGWFHTGDIGQARDGKFYFVDRKKDLIIKGGINIVPLEVEEILYKHSQVHECVVVGKDEKMLGEDVVAVVVPKADGDRKELVLELKKLCKEHLSNYKVPSRIFIWDQLPRTHSHKLMRRKVRELINESVDLDFLIEAVSAAGKAAKDIFESKKYDFISDFKTEKFQEKSPKELLSEEDLMCQEIILEAISEHDPQAAVYSEELNNLEVMVADKTSKKYLIDPLDGTHNFCFGLPFWGISVAVLNAENVPIAGVIYLPEMGLLLKCDGPGHPTMVRSNGIWSETSTAQTDIPQALICYDNQFYKLGEKAFRIYQNLTKECFTTRITGSAVADSALIACGKINGRVWNKTNAYDIASGIPIVKGAGGIVSDFEGNEVTIFSPEVIMSSSKMVNEAIVEIIRRSS